MVVPNAEGGTVSLVDARTFATLRELNVLPDGPDAAFDEDDASQALIGQRVVEAAGGTNYAQDVDVAPDGRTLYVSRGHRGDIAAFDLASGAMRWKLRIPGFRSDHMTISADGSRLYVSALTENRVQVVDPARPAIVGSFETGQWPHDNHLSPDGRRLYNGSIGNIVAPAETRAAYPTPPYQLTVVDPATLEPLRTHAFERGIRPFAITHDESRMYAQLSEYHGVIEFDLREGRIARTRDLPVDEGVTEDDYDFEAPHHGLAISGDERTLCLAGRASDYVALVDTRTFTPSAIVDVDDAPGWAATAPDGRHCFVANTRADTISVISYADRREVARLRGGDGPKLIQAARLPAAVVCTSRSTPGCAPELGLRRTCRASGGLELRLTGETDAVTRLDLKVGGRTLASDARTPFVRTLGRRTQRRLRGRTVRAIATVSRGPAARVKRTTTVRGCA
jgi:DNA-binding beta-propeller fold protein YncE